MTDIDMKAPTVRHPRADSRGRRWYRSLLVAGALLAGTAAVGAGPTALAGPPPPPPSLCAGNTTVLFGPNTCVFSPTTPEATIQADLNAIAAQQVPVASQFDTQRYDILFAPGTYGSTTDPLIFQVGYYTEVAGLGLTPGQTIVYGAAEVNNQCVAPGNCIGLDNFWRSLSNLTITVTTAAACTEGTEFWAASQAAPIRRVDINGNFFMFDYCSSPGYVSGGFMAGLGVQRRSDHQRQQSAGGGPKLGYRHLYQRRLGPGLLRRYERARDQLRTQHQPVHQCGRQPGNW